MSDATPTVHPRANEPADRTTLAWTRTAFAFLANGALLMIRNLHGPVGPWQLVPALLAAVVALATYLIAVQRQRTLQRQPLPARVTPRRQVYGIGAAVLVLIVVTMVAQLV
ncbi:hypothetical protein AWB92_12650 [Mycobacterium sp. IEC1808]|uniref:DUF202 domain-containing protein n=1 Tax=Mycobacterium sp. IEC1808 TaxID=1743230 RepID=UPI000A154F2E|nr:DUF202 domain-containing protein [Mycobacterium sp. IEC1808]ORW93975.1 hypothetical protein AWB92_12650 [Mycobacterium sp. IEC1808]